MPAWLNDVTLYHNRGDTTFVGENSLYGDFFGLDDLFTENPRVVQGMIDVYETWIADFGVDGFRIDTMKHVDDAFWQRFAPEVLAFARAQGKREFLMFGEVFDTTKTFTSHFTTRDRVQAVLDFPFQAAAQRFAANSGADRRPAGLLRRRRLVHGRGLQRLPAPDVPRATTTWAASAASSSWPTPTRPTPSSSPATGWRTSSCTSRAATRSSTTATSRASSATAATRTRGRTCSRARSRPTTTTTSSGPTPRPRPPTSTRPTRSTARSASSRALTRHHEALRDGAQIHRLSSTAPGVYAFSRIDRRDQREYVVVLNNSEQAQTATIPTYSAKRDYLPHLRRRPPRLESNRSGGLSVTVQPLSAVVYKLWGQIPKRRGAAHRA